MQRIRSTWLTLVVVLILTVVLLAIGIGVIARRSQREERYLALNKQVVAIVDEAFNEPPPQFEDGTPWAYQQSYDFWTKVMEYEPQVQGFKRAGFYRATPAAREINPGTLAYLFFDHITEKLKPLGFEITRPVREKLSHGHRSTLTYVDDESGLRAEITFVDGPEGYIYASGDVGEAVKAR